MTELIRLGGLTKRFGEVTVLDKIDFVLCERELVAVTGPSGCGKSTLLNIMGLLDGYTSGAVSWFGRGKVRPNSRAATTLMQSRISYLFQSFALIEDETVLRNLLLAMRYVKQPQLAKKQACEEALERVGLAGFANRRVFELSGGEQQRVAIARLLVKPCDVVLADEPTGSLDAENRDLVLDLLLGMHRGGKSVVIVTHDEHVAGLCERRIRLERGRLATVDPQQSSVTP